MPVIRMPLSLPSLCVFRDSQVSCPFYIQALHLPKIGLFPLVLSFMF
jgi:hypothetical protein